MTDHPNPFGTDLQNYKKVREDIILSFSEPQQMFLRKHRWTYRREKLNTNVKISFPYYFSQAEDTYFRILFHDYKLFNYCGRSLSSFFNIKQES